MSQYCLLKALIRGSNQQPNYLARNAKNQAFRSLIFKIFRGSMPPDPLGGLGLRPRVTASRSLYQKLTNRKPLKSPPQIRPWRKRKTSVGRQTEKSFFFLILLDSKQAVPYHLTNVNISASILKMVRWSIRLTHLTRIIMVIRYHLVQVRQKLKKSTVKLASYVPGLVRTLGHYVLSVDHGHRQSAFFALSLFWLKRTLFRTYLFSFPLRVRKN